MADLIGPFDTAPWSQDQWFRFASMWAPSGVIGPASSSVDSGSFGVTASGLSLSVATGRYWVRGSGFEPEAVTVKAVTVNSNASLYRRDRLVVRRDLAAKTITLEVKAGTASATPTAPSLTQSETGIWEVPVCSFLVPPASATTLSGFVDERGWLSSTRSGLLSFTSTTARDAHFPSPVQGDACIVAGAPQIHTGSDWGSLVNNAGTQSVMAGTAPPDGTPLLVKTLFGFLVTDASGNYTLTLPGGAYANGLVAVVAQVAADSPVDWKVTAFTLSTVTLRIYNTASGASAGALSIRSSFTAWGW